MSKKKVPAQRKAGKTGNAGRRARNKRVIAKKNKKDGAKGLFGSILGRRSAKSRQLPGQRGG